MPEDFEFAVIIEFDDVDGLKRYLQHPRTPLGPALHDVGAAALAYDYEMSKLRTRTDRDHDSTAQMRESRLTASGRDRDRRGRSRSIDAIARAAAIDSAALIATRRCEPLSRPFVYQEFSARSLLITQRSRPRAGCAAAAGVLTGRDVPESLPLRPTRSCSSRSM